MLIANLANYKVQIKRPHAQQQLFIDSPAKRKIIRAGRRSGKTTGAAIKAMQTFLAKKRVLYAVPSQEQVDRFWHEVKNAMSQPIDAGAFYCNETLHVIEMPGTETRIKAKTAWNSDMLRGDYCDLLILDEWQLMNEDAWELVGAPMLLDRNGDAIFIYTPPSLHSRSTSKARDPLHAYKMFRAAQQDKTGRWAAFHFTSHDNPYISTQALSDLTQDMTSLAIRQEIYAEDTLEVPGALWKREWFDVHRHLTEIEYVNVVVGVDPSATSGGDECGIIVCAKGKDGLGYVLDDRSIQASPAEWARRVVEAYHEHHANMIIAEANQGGEMVGQTIHSIDANVPIKYVHASRGKQARAEPISALYEKQRIFHVRAFIDLEEQLVTWSPDSGESPDRLDALVWGMTELMLGARVPWVR